MAYDPNQPRDKLGRWTDGNPSTIDIEIDELVPCLKDATDGEYLDTEVAPVPRSELKRFTKKNGWGVDWAKRPADENVFGVYLKGDTEPQGLISLRYDEGGTYIGFVSAAPHNNKHLLNGKEPRYYGVGGHLFALAVEQSTLHDGDGVVFGYAANKKLLEHYVNVFGAVHCPVMHEYQFIIEGEASIRLLNEYSYERNGFE